MKDKLPLIESLFSNQRENGAANMFERYREHQFHKLTELQQSMEAMHKTAAEASALKRKAEEATIELNEGTKIQNALLQEQIETLKATNKTLSEQLEQGFAQMTDRQKLEDLISQADRLIERNVDSCDPEFSAWKRKSERFLLKRYGEDSLELKQFREFDFTLCAFSSATPKTAWNKACVCDLTRVKEIFKTLVDEMEDDKELPANRIETNAVFIVHGLDGELKSEVARLVEKVGLRAVILNEQANSGATIIEKFEKNSNVGAAICLFTADDRCVADNDSITNRARQNVVFETGYFYGKLGRNRVMLLADRGVEIPSDMHGVVYTNTTSWQFELCKELKAMGYSVDLNRLTEL